MNVRGAVVQGGLAALGLAAAYVTWQREPDRAPGEVTVLDASKGDIQKIRYEGEAGKWVELERKKEPGEEEPRVWLKLSAEAAKKVPERLVGGNESADRLWAKFAPLSATRALGVLGADKLKELGLDAPKKKLEVTLRGAPRVFDIGASPFNVSSPYVKERDSGRVYVLGGSVLADLDGASTRLIDRSLHSFKAGDYDTVTVSAGGHVRGLSAPSADSSMAAKLVDPKSSKPDEMAKNWHDKLWRSYTVETLGRGEAPTNGTPEISCKVEYTFRGKPKGFIEIGKLAPPPVAASTSAPPAAELWARTEHTASWTKLPATMEDTLKECSKIAGGE